VQAGEADPGDRRGDGAAHDVLARSFDDTAVAYELGRPEYPVAAIDWWAGRGAFPSGGVILDLAAGTGKLTRGLVGRGCEVVAVEPLANMRAQLASALPEVRLLDGTAEAIPLPDASVDSVVVGQAFHWFDQQRALVEIRRVLRLGGGLGLIWNDEDPSRATDWVALVTDVKSGVGGGHVQHGIEVTIGAMATSHLFGPTQVHTVPWWEPTTPERVLANVLSRSYVTVLDDAGRERVLAPIRAALAGAAVPLRYPHVASAFWCPAI
jgi:ubiquinone/menaquinone biosynthesis C-methylase UbiE